MNNEVIVSDPVKCVQGAQSHMLARLSLNTYRIGISIGIDIDVDIDVLI